MLIATAIVAMALGAVMGRLRVQWAALRAERAAVTQFECHSDSEVHSSIRIYPNIEWFVLTGLELTDAGVREVAASYQRGELPHLTGIVIGGPAITDQGIKAIGCMTSLTTLTIQDTPITDHGLEGIQSLRNLEHFSLLTPPLEPLEYIPDPSDTRITHRGLEYIGKLPRLCDVTLFHVFIGDEEFKVLESLPEGCRLDVSWTNATIERLRDFKAKRPDIAIWANSAIRNALDN
jgi:hypothetical protein